MAEIKIDNARYWKNCIDAIDSIVEEGVLEIEKEGISLKALDPSGISMVSFFIPNKAFSKYDVDKAVNIGINLDNLSKILNSSRSTEQLLMKDSGNKFAIEFIGENTRRRYTLPTIDIKKGENKEPKIEFDATVNVKGDSLKEMLKDANLLSSYINFKTDKGTFKVVAKGDAGELEEEHDEKAEFIKKLQVSKPTSASFNLDYLQKIVNPSPSNSEIILSLKTDDPIKIEYNIGDAQLSYYLAPYIES
ncbi:MAG: proliferating cell nuclear antigen (pcna) [Candidatus Micrarchaeaceae archaeon]